MRKVSRRQNAQKGAEPEKVTAVHEFTDNSGDKGTIASRFVLASYLFNKEFAKETDINTLEFSLPIHKSLQEYISKKQKSEEPIKFNDLYEEISEEYSDELSRLAGLETEENKKYDESIYFADCVRALKLQAINNEINRLTELFKAETETEQRKKLAAEMSRMFLERTKLS